MKTILHKRIKLFLAFLIIFSNSIIAQKNSDKGDKLFDKNLFNDAIPFYELEIKLNNNKTIDHALLKLADCYRITGEFEKAEATYKILLKKKKKDPKAIMNYALSLKSSAKYAEAAIQFKEYLKLNPSDPRGKMLLQSCDLAQTWLEQTIGKEVRNVEKINTPSSDFAPVFSSPNELIFTSSRFGGKQALISFDGGLEVHKLDLYDVNINSIDEKDKAEIENMKDINTPLHEGPATFTKDGKELYFTRTVTGKKDKQSNKVLNTLQIFYSIKDSTNKWSKPINAFAFNSTDYSIGQPSISKDGKTIYFMSDMPGGFGATDIYYCRKQNDGTWSLPINAGNEINTFGHELFPYISDNGTLYFSSDAHPGMGQLDIFSSELIGKKWTNVNNMKPPINSIANDFGMALDGKYLRGFFSSDRFNGKGAEDIYSFSETTPLKLTINGETIQFEDKSIFDGIKYKLVDEKNKVDIALIPKDGVYLVPIKEAQEYTLVAKKNGFSYNKIAMSMIRDTLGNYLEVKLKPSLRAINVDGYLVSGLTNDTSKFKSKKLPLEKISVSLIDSTTTIEKIITDKKGFFGFSEVLNANESYTISSKINVLKDPPDPTINCKGLVTYMGNPIANSSIQLLDNDKLIENVQTNEKGMFNFNLDLNKKYTISAGKTGFNNSSTTFFTSNSDAKNGIFKTLVLDSLGSVNLKGNVKDGAGPVENVQIVIRNGNKIIGEVKSLLDGTFKYSLLPEQEYIITATVNGYLQKEISISTKNIPKSSIIPAEIFLDSIKINSVIELKNLYYDYDKPDVQYTSLSVLDKLVEFMKINPKIIIELSANTDSRGNPEYNLKLSQARAQNAKDYLILEDISPDRVIPVGNGKNKPIILTAKTEKEHQINRRTEIKILKNK
jgi:outer membrane protein OmpA-like peptidoglycan-associated protein/tetratricopeptide (TPR) repeat protein